MDGESEIIETTGDWSISAAICIAGNHVSSRIIVTCFCEKIIQSRRKMDRNDIILARWMKQPTPLSFVGIRHCIPVASPSRIGLHKTISKLSVSERPSYVFPGPSGSVDCELKKCQVRWSKKTTTSSRRKVKQKKRSCYSTYLSTQGWGKYSIGCDKVSVNGCMTKCTQD